MKNFYFVKDTGKSRKTKTDNEKILPNHTPVTNLYLEYMLLKVKTVEINNTKIGKIVKIKFTKEDTQLVSKHRKG